MIGFFLTDSTTLDEVKMMETIKLSTIVLAVTPELVSCLTPEELDLQIVLRDGLHSLQTMQWDDVLEIIEASILHHKPMSSLVH